MHIFTGAVNGNNTTRENYYFLNWPMVEYLLRVMSSNGHGDTGVYCNKQIISIRNFSSGSFLKLMKNFG